MVRDGGAVPGPWRAAPVVRIDEATLAEPADVVGRLHRAWSARQPVVVALAVDPGSFRAAATWDDAPWTLGPWFEPWMDRLHFLVWANTYDARDGEPVWWWARKAERLGADATPDGPADVVLADGRPAWVDGGPRAPLGRRRRRRRRARRLGRARAPRARPAPTWPRPPTSLPTSWPPSPTAPARRG